MLEILQHQNLSKSLTRQASDWILLKKQLAQFDEEYRWSQVSYHDNTGKTFSNISFVLSLKYNLCYFLNWG